jgi:hypothetical protein
MPEMAVSAGISDHNFTDDSQEFEAFIPSPSAADQQQAFKNLTACLAEQGKWLAANRLKRTKTRLMLSSYLPKIALRNN